MSGFLGVAAVADMSSDWSARLFALNAYEEPRFVYARLYYKREACKWTGRSDDCDLPENQRWVKGPIPERDGFHEFKYSPIFLDKVPGVTVLSHILFEEDAIAVYLFVKTRHPEAAKIVLQRDNERYCSSLEVKHFEMDHWPKAFESLMRKINKKNVIEVVTKEIQIKDYLPN